MMMRLRTVVPPSALAVVVALVAAGAVLDARPAAQAEAPERRYLIERIDDAAVAQIHADGSETLDLLVELFTADGDAALARYRAQRAEPLLAGGGAAGASLFELRQQQEPATALDRPLYAGLYPLERRAPAPAPPAAIDGIALLGSAAYARIGAYGEPAPAGAARPSAMLVLSHPTDIGFDAEYNAWYTDNHMIDVARSPHFRAATRYAPRRQLAGAPLGYLCVYEIDAPYAPELHRGLMHWLTETPDDFRQPMPETPSGEGVLTLDLWGYFARIWSMAN